MVLLLLLFFFASQTRSIDLSWQTKFVSNFVYKIINFKVYLYLPQRVNKYAHVFAIKSRIVCDENKL